MLVSKMLYQRPTVKSVDLHYHVQVSQLDPHASPHSTGESDWYSDLFRL